MLFDYWGAHPTAADILKAVYKVETKASPAPAAAQDIAFGPEFNLSPLECRKALANKTAS